MSREEILASFKRDAAAFPRSISGPAPMPDDLLDPRVAELTMNGWRFRLALLVPPEGQVVYWHLSAAIFPSRRRTYEQDWVFLGQATKLLGVPDGACLDLHEDGSTTHYVWQVPKVVCRESSSGM